ncbi:MAG TPA: hypothetical protein VK722_18805 [Candidatus Aquilonibacter sp.]|jgi:hypothetical protein|nr:hypothetical protein [Candidatus Aquilonibacter sp.]
MPPVSIQICQNFSAAPGSGVDWTDIPPTGCALEPVKGSAWPFTSGPPINLPSPSSPAATIKGGLKAGTYYFQPTYCKKPVCVTVT